MINKIKVLHIVHNEKFIDSVIGVFDTRADVISKYVCLAKKYPYSSVEAKNKYLDRINNKERIELLSYEAFREMLSNGWNFDVVFLHSLGCAGLVLRPLGKYDDLLVNLPTKVKLVWSSWGMDIYEYGIPLVKLDLFLPRTYFHRIFSNIPTHILNFTKAAMKYRRRKNLLRRVDYCSTVLPFEYDLLRATCPYLKAKQVLFRYADPKKFASIPQFIPYPKRENNIILGNSAAPTCNHLDVLCRLSKIKLGSKKVYTPLSYGDSKNALYIRKQGAKLLPSNFEPLLNFMPYEQYQTIFDSCSNAIYANIRQQAVGNIRLAFHKGLKVFFSEKASFVEYFRNLGYKFFLIERDLNEEELNTPLPVQYAEQNYNVWREGAQKCQKDFDDMIDLIKSDIERERNSQR